MRTIKYIGPLSLPTDLYQRLDQQARASERDTLQQARWLLRQALADQADPDRDLALVGTDRPDPQAA